MLDKILEMVRANKEVDWTENDPAKEFAELEKEIEALKWQTKHAPMRLITAQEVAIKCAYADLVGAYQAMSQQDYSVHDWTAHRTTIEDLEDCFPDIITDPIELPEANHD